MAAQILLIEDDTALMGEMNEYLTRRHFEVRACTTIAEAELALKEMHPDVVLSDICLPDGDGAVFCMAHAGQLPDVRWLLMSGNQELARQNRTRESGDNPPMAILDKPVAMKTIADFLRAAAS